MKIERASSLNRIMHCPGSSVYDSDELVATADTNAKLGRKIHAYLAGQIEDTDLEPSELKLAYTAKNYLMQVLQITGFDSEWKIISIEERYESPDLELTGQPDLVIKGEKADEYAIIDYKAIGDHIHPVSNWQLRAYAVLVADKLDDYKDGYLVIIQLQEQPHIKMAKYTKQELLLWRKQLEARLYQIAKGQELINIPGSYCKYCPGKDRCNEFNGALSLGLNIGKALESFINSPNEHKVKYLYILKAAEQLKKQVEEWCRNKLIEDKNAFDGLINLKAPRKIKEVKDKRGLYEALVTSNISYEDMLNCIDIRISEVEKFLDKKEIERFYEVKETKPSLNY